MYYKFENSLQLDGSTDSSLEVSIVLSDVTRFTARSFKIYVINILFVLEVEMTFAKVYDFIERTHSVPRDSNNKGLLAW